MPPGPSGLRAFASLQLARRDPLRFFTRMAAQYGDIAMARLGQRAVVLLDHPDHVRELLVTQQKRFRKSRTLRRARVLLGDGLLTSEGELHLRQRRLIQPAFHHERIAAYARTMVERARATAARWQSDAIIDARDEMMRLTLDVAARTLFSAKVEDEADEIGRALDTVMSMFDRLHHPWFEVIQRLPLPSTRRFLNATARLEATILRIIGQRRASGKDRGDLLSMLLLAQDEGAGGGMSDAQVRDEVLTLFLAGHETTANALAWTWLLLADNPDAEARLHVELATVLGERPPGVEDLPRLDYTRRVLAESMRLYPPAWVVGREALEDVEIGGYTIPRGAMVFASQWLLHRDGRFFDEPLRFDPDRWLPEREATLHRYAYFPFGAGTRKCIGESFAWTEGTLVLSTLASRWRLRRATPDPVGLQPVITLRPAGPVRMRLERRPGAA